MSFQRITITGSIRSSLNRLARAARATSSASSSISLIAHDLVRRAAHPLQAAEQRRELLGRPNEQPAELDRLLRRRLDAVEPEQLRRVLGRVGDVVDRERERDQVLAVERRHEQRVRLAEQLGDDAVGVVLELLHLVLRRAGRPVDDPPLHRPGDLERRLAGLREQHVDLAATRRRARASCRRSP